MDLRALAPKALFSGSGRIGPVQFIAAAAYQFMLAVACGMASWLALFALLPSAFDGNLLEAGFFGGDGRLSGTGMGILAAALLIEVLGILIGTFMAASAMRLRCHDLGLSGWWSLAVAAPLIYFCFAALGYVEGASVAAVLAWIALSALATLPGPPADNRYGPRGAL